MKSDNMCGINGFNWKDINLIENMNMAIKHRGPDDSGAFSDHMVSLGHVRLSIIDLSEKGHQPMEYEQGDRKAIITYNGEIYNFIDIRKDLEKKGYSFKSKTDTEVILAAYLEWGTHCVDRFDGMWAFAIYDVKESKLFLSRDRLGIKPLYYYSDGKKFLFSSEVKGILKKEGLSVSINESALVEYLMFRSTIGEETFVKGIKKLMPGHNLIFYLDKKEMKIRKYWDIGVENAIPYEKLALKNLRERMKKSVERRMLSDVSVGSILSGGLDSSILTAYMIEKNPKLNTFTVRFRDSDMDEGEYATTVSTFLDTKHHEIWLDFDDFMRGMEEYSSLKDEPIGVPNEIALFILSKEIRNKEVFVVLSGEGSDEIFYGYNRIFRAPFDLERMRILKMQDNGREFYRKKMKSLYEKYDGRLFESLEDIILYLYPYWNKDDIESVLNNPSLAEKVIESRKRDIEDVLARIPSDDYHKLSYFFLKIHLPTLLNRVDNSTMMNAVESRVPFLSHELVEFVFSLPNQLKSPFKSIEDMEKAIWESSDEIAEKRDIPKYILKKLAEGRVPDEIIWRRKVGFPIPFVEWKDRLMEYAEKTILSDGAMISRYFRKDAIESFVKKALNSKNNYHIQRIWMLISIELWLKKWSDSICKQ